MFVPSESMRHAASESSGPTAEEDATAVGRVPRLEFIGLDPGSGSSPVSEGNTFEDNTTANNVIEGAAAVPEVLANNMGNTVCGHATNISAAGWVDVDLARNEVCDAALATAP